MTEHILTYKGRAGLRSDGQLRRQQILDATLNVIAREGVRGVRHRAVAKEADVPLASTTYYFKDIKDLISDAMTYFAEQIHQKNTLLEQQSFELLSSMRDQSLKDPCVRDVLSEQLTQFVFEHIRHQLADPRARLLENAFYDEALRNPDLGKTMRLLDQLILERIGRFFEQLGSLSHQADAKQVFALIRLIEYQAMLNQNPDIEPEMVTIAALVTKLVAAIP